MATTPPAPSPSPPRDTVVDQRVVALRGMFPDYDDLILQSVLESARGDQDRAIDILLGMTDPDFQAEPPSQQQQQQPQAPVAPILSQTDLDEQFARQLVMQEQQQETERWLQAHPQSQSQSAGAGAVPPGVYHPSRTAVSAGGGARSPQQQPPSEFQEQFTKIAESGKKTFGNIFSKVKAKLQEFEQGRPTNPNQPAPSGSGSAPYPPYATHPGQQQQQQVWSPPQAQAQAQPAYFDPNPTSAPTTRSPPTSQLGQVQVQGYDVSAAEPLLSTSSSSPSTATQLQPEPSPQPQAQSIPPPPATSQGAPIDAGKLGILPKKPVSLLRDPASPASGSTSSTSGTSGPNTTALALGAGAAAAAVGATAGAVALEPAPSLAHSHSFSSQQSDDDYSRYNDVDEHDKEDEDDGLEYAENPFDDDRAGGGRK